MAHDLKNRTTDVLNSENQNKTFEHFQFQTPILEGLSKNGYIVPSPIQILALPYTLAGLDVVVQSKSGTGKTLVYVLSAISSIDVESKSLQGLLIAPTREIAVQVRYLRVFNLLIVFRLIYNHFYVSKGAQTMLEVGGHLPKLKASTFIGGMSVEEDKLKLSKCHMAFGSPGRVKQLIEEGIMNCEDIKIFILDEADKLCEKSFREDLKWIMGALPASVQTLALSATYPDSLEYSHVCSQDSLSCKAWKRVSGPLGMNQFVLESPHHGLPKKVVDLKFERLLKVLSSVSFEQCIVFCNYSLRARAICDKLNDQGWPAIFLAGMQEQKDRLNSLKDLRAFRCRIVLTTDLSARGIDARHVNLVINFDVPSSGTTYLHRIGRAGRYGSKGIALSIAAKGTEMKNLASIAQNTNSDVRVVSSPELDLWEVSMEELNALEQTKAVEVVSEENQSDKEENNPKNEIPIKDVPHPMNHKGDNSPQVEEKKEENVSQENQAVLNKLNVPPKAQKKKNKKKRESKEPTKPKTPEDPFSQDIIDAELAKEREFDNVLDEVMQLSKDMSLGDVYSKVRDGTLAPKSKRVPSTSQVQDPSVPLPPPVMDSMSQWVQMWQAHQMQHRRYLNYMIQCQQSWKPR
ncbi:Uncharacterized protein FKW44_001793 [Caligus rogercresseyi]|uniref:RNA helicase n=1 Tax=Caligus rogercresseyi TaxID=217165 RepID=A0A7T8KJF6_CALRO|nr:Uncharacterized protein FKW44_001793 [Caligus rogercresseyi]